MPDPVNRVAELVAKIAERRAKVTEHLGQKPLDAALVDTWRLQNEALRGAFARIAREPVPLSLSLSQPLPVRAAAVPIKAGPTIARPTAASSPRDSRAAVPRGSMALVIGDLLSSFGVNVPVQGEVVRSSLKAELAGTPGTD